MTAEQKSDFVNWRPWMVVVGLTVVILVTMGMLYVANKDFPGVVENDYYKKGVYYNVYTSRMEAQKRRGWQLRFGWVSRPIAGQPFTLRAVVVDKQGQPIQGGQVNITLLRPGTPKLDQTLQAKEVAPGDYQVSVLLSRAGNWDINTVLSRGQDTHEQSSTLWVVPRAEGAP